MYASNTTTDPEPYITAGSGVAEVRANKEQLTRNIAAVVADLVRRNNHTSDSFAELVGTPRVKVRRQLDGAVPFNMSELAALGGLGWAKPSQIILAAERGEMYPQPFGEQSIPLATWAPPAWATIRKMDTGQIYAERWADRTHAGGGVAAHIVLYQIDEIVDRSGEYRVVRHAPMIDFNEVDLTIEDAQSKAYSGDRADPEIDALVELLVAYDGGSN